jgi:hypothetical protein
MEQAHRSSARGGGPGIWRIIEAEPVFSAPLT